MLHLLFAVGAAWFNFCSVLGQRAQQCLGRSVASIGAKARWQGHASPGFPEFNSSASLGTWFWGADAFLHPVLQP